MSDNSIAIRTEVPISMHPDVLIPQAKALDVEKTVGRPALAAGREALTAMYKTYGAMEDAERALHAASVRTLRRQKPDGRSEYLGDLRLVGNRIRHFHGHEEEFAVAAEAAFKRTASVVDRRMEELKRHRDALAARVTSALDDGSRKTPEGLSLSQEVRSHVKGLKGSARLLFLKNAVDADDKRTIAAVFAAPAYLSGVTDEHLSLVRDHAARKWAAQDHAQLAAVGETIERVMTSSAHFLKRYGKAIEFKSPLAARAGRKLEELAKS